MILIRDDSDGREKSLCISHSSGKILNKLKNKTTEKACFHLLYITGVFFSKTQGKNYKIKMIKILRFHDQNLSNCLGSYSQMFLCED